MYRRASVIRIPSLLSSSLHEAAPSSGVCKLNDVQGELTVAVLHAFNMTMRSKHYANTKNVSPTWCEGGIEYSGNTLMCWG